MHVEGGRSEALVHVIHEVRDPADGGLARREVAGVRMGMLAGPSRHLAVDALERAFTDAIRGPQAGERGGQDLDLIHLRDTEPLPTDVAAQFVSAGNLIDLEDVAAFEIPAVDVGFDDAKISAVVHLDEVTAFYRFIDIKIHGLGPRSPGQCRNCHRPRRGGGHRTHVLRHVSHAKRGDG
jgi:hypothetical protein